MSFHIIWFIYHASHMNHTIWALKIIYYMDCFKYLFKNSGLTMTYRLNSDPINNAKIIIAAGQSQVFSHFLHSRIFILTELSKIRLKWLEYPKKVFSSNAIIRGLSKLSNHSRSKDQACFNFQIKLWTFLFEMRIDSLNENLSINYLIIYLV